MLVQKIEELKLKITTNGPTAPPSGLTRDSGELQCRGGSVFSTERKRTDPFLRDQDPS